MGYIGVQIYICKSRVIGMDTLRYKYTFAKVGGVEYIGVQIYICKSGVSGVNWRTNMHL